jgi:tetratricopeptide (TPR) repeat protein
VARHIPKRAYQERTPDPERRRDTDSARDTARVKILYYAGAGAIIGGLGGAFKWGLPGFLIGGALGYGFVFFTVTSLVEGSGALLGKIYHPRGESTPHKREYSEPQALVLRGLFQEAIDCYETYVAEFPDDPEPCIGLARVYRDHLQRYDDAVTWFRRARGAAGMDSGREILVTREIIEIYVKRLGQPERAIPELARLADRFAGTREGHLAKAEIERIRAELRARPEA